MNRLLARTVGPKAPRRDDDAKLYERTEVVPHSLPLKYLAVDHPVHVLCREALSRGRYAEHLPCMVALTLTRQATISPSAIMSSIS